MLGQKPNYMFGCFVLEIGPWATIIIIIIIILSFWWIKFY